MTEDEAKTMAERIAESRPVEAFQDRVAAASASFTATREQLLEQLGATMDEIKPRLRGWIHLASIPLVVIGGLVLLVFTPTLEARAVVAVFVFASILLFSVSATYHRSNGWVGPRTQAFLQRTDHASISVLIAGTTTPLAYLLLDDPARWMLLGTMWTATAVSIITKFAFAHPPRWINVPVFILLGWMPAFFMADLYAGAVELSPERGFWAFLFIITGGLLYSVGGILFAWRPGWLELKPKVAGYHEVFHLFTLLGFVAHYVAVSLIAYSV